MFDVARATVDWLDDLRRSRSLREPDLESLKARLKVEMGSLKDQGLSPREAFYVGRSRVTPEYPLPEEHAGAGAQGVRRDRLRWIGAGILAYLFFSCLVWLLSLAGTKLAASAGIDWNWLLLASASLQILLAGGAFFGVVFLLPNMGRLGIAAAFQRLRRSRMGSAVLYLFLVASAIGLALGSSLASGEELLYRFGRGLHGQALRNAYSETMAAHELIFVLALVIALVSILFWLGGRKDPKPPAGVER